MAYIKHLKKGKNDVLIDAEFRIKCEKAIEKFSNSDQQVYEFPTSLTNVERAFVHNLAPKFGLKTKSSGYGPNRRLSLFKPVEQEDFSCLNCPIELTSHTKGILKDFFAHYPPKDELDVESFRYAPIQTHCPTVLRQQPIVPPPGRQNDVAIERSRQKLPIFEYKINIIDTIERNRVTLVHGSTGSGKTTQIPQYIMDLAVQEGKPCRILCTQPRRISAIASAERVCYERGVELGTSVGYQIRLDSKADSKSNCVFLTPGVFLRYLMSMKPNDVFKKITHCIIDEAHEHAKENDFLLTSIREHMDANPNLKVIIMSATMDTAVFKNYFGGHCEEITIFSKQFEVVEYYLDDVLKMVNFTNKRVEELQRQYERGEVITASKSAYVNSDEIKMEDLDEEAISYLDELLDNMSTSDCPENHFHQFLYEVQNENLPVNYRHSTTKMTPLMIAIGKGLESIVENLLCIKADPNLQINFGGIDMSSIDLAVNFFGENSRMHEILLKKRTIKTETSNEESFNKALVNIYQDTILKSKTNNFVLEESIDHEILVQLIEKIHFGYEDNGAILVFLPGFDDIIQQAQLINSRIRHGYTLFMLHSSMRTDDQKNVFKPAYQGKRKIILSTNIAESSITIDDVVYVIDSGREKQKSFDAISHSSSLRVQWISKASANQRRGRAGRLRDGVVFRVYSRDRFQSMLEVTIPELLRTSLAEVCLQTKLLINDSSSIEQFLLKCIAGPSVANIRQSIKYLQKLGALDKSENLTLLGSHLAHMPVDAKYGKMLIYAIVFKCLNPILSLVSILTMGDQIFLLPISSADRMNCIQWRKNVAGESHSDHFMMLRVFQMWLNLKETQQNDRRFCEENFISRNHIEHVRGVRRQILSYLETSHLVQNQRNFNDNSENWSVLKAVICAGLYPCIAKIERRSGMMYTEIDTKLSFHMSSVLYVKKEGYKSTIRKLPAEWTVFEEKNRIGRMSMLKCNTLLNSLTVSLIAGRKLIEEDYSALKEKRKVNGPDSGWTDQEWEAMVDDNMDVDYEPEFIDFKADLLLKFNASKEDTKMIFDLKKCLNNLVTRFLSEKHFKATSEDDKLIEVLARIIEKEDIYSGMKKIDISDHSVEKTYENSRVQNPRQPQRDFKLFNNKPSSNYQKQDNFQRQNFKGQQNHSNFVKMETQRNHQGTANFQQNHSNLVKIEPQSQRSYQGTTSFATLNQPDQRQAQQEHQANFTSFYHNSHSQDAQQRLMGSINNPRPSTSNRAPNAAPRRKIEVNYSNEKFILLKVNSKKFMEELAHKVVLGLCDLNLKQWQFHKLKAIAKKGTQIKIIFYSTHKHEFQGYGDVVAIKESQDVNFHFRRSRPLKIQDLSSDNFGMEVMQIVSQQNFAYHELDNALGNSLMLYFQ